jgi:hypothetical protein
MEDTGVDQRNKIQKHLTDRYEHKQILLEETKRTGKKYVDELWQRIIENQKIRNNPPRAKGENGGHRYHKAQQCKRDRCRMDRSTKLRETLAQPAFCY